MSYFYLDATLLNWPSYFNLKANALASFNPFYYPCLNYYIRKNSLLSQLFHYSSKMRSWFYQAGIYFYIPEGQILSETSEYAKFT